MNFKKKYSWLNKVIHHDVEDGFELFGQNQHISEASEPSNIIWENIDIRRKDRNLRKCYIGLI